MKITSATLTAVTPDGYPVEIPLILDEGEKITEAIARLTAVLGKNGWEPPQSQANGNGASQAGHTVSFPADKMTATVDDGQAYWKVKGGQYQKFGVSIWPEALEASGFDPADLNPLKPIDLRGWTAVCVLKEDGQPKKVIRLEKGGG